VTDAGGGHAASPTGRRILLLVGSVGAGKGTQAAALSGELGLAHLANNAAGLLGRPFLEAYRALIERLPAEGGEALAKLERLLESWSLHQITQLVGQIRQRLETIDLFETGLEHPTAAELGEQAVREGINPRNLVVIQNLIVDVLQHYFFDRRDEYDAYADDAFFAERGLERDGYYVMTCHRRENVHIRSSLEAVLRLIGAADAPVYFTASYRTQKQLEVYGLTLPPNVIMVDPIGYKELLALLGRLIDLAETAQVRAQLRLVIRLIASSSEPRGSTRWSGSSSEQSTMRGIPPVQSRIACAR